jgi:hypothetical protein
MKELIRKYGLLAILSGILLITLVIYVEHCLKHQYGHLENFPTVMTLGLQFGDHLGIAFLSIGIIGLLFEMPEWRERFHKEIEMAIDDVDHLKKLKLDELIKQQIIILKAVFNNQEIDKEGSFLNFYFTKIQQYIGSAYREETTGVTIIDYLPNTQSFIVQETISYTCRTLGEHIQREVQWTTKKDEIDGIEDFRILVRVPEQISNSPRFANDYPNIVDSEVIFRPTDSPTRLTAWEQGHGYTLSLDNYKGINGLFIETSVTYVVPRDRAFSWTMPYPSKGLTGEIRFPKELKIYVDSFWIEPDDRDSIKFKSEENPGVYTYNYPTWLLPGDGFAFHFRKITPDAASETNAQPEAPELNINDQVS